MAALKLAIYRCSKLWRMPIVTSKAVRKQRLLRDFPIKFTPVFNDGKVVWQDDRNNTNKKYRGWAMPDVVVLDLMLPVKIISLNKGNRRD